MTSISTFRLENEILDLVSRFPGLRLMESTQDITMIEGSIEIIDETGKTWGNYQVKIVIPKEYPNALPELLETGGQIKRHESWHINNNGTCCLSPRGSEIRLFTGGGNLHHWVESFVVPFLANHMYKMKTGEYANKEYSHGAKGILEFYQEEWGIKNPKVILKRLQIIAGQRIERNQPCFCGSKEKYKNCHEKGIQLYNGIPIEVYRNDLADIQKERSKLSL